MFWFLNMSELWIFSKYSSKSREIVFRPLFLCGHYFVQYGQWKSALSMENLSLSFCTFCVFCLFCVKFNVIFIKFTTFAWSLFIRVSGNLCLCPHLWETRPKNLIKQHACRELLSFWVLKIPFIKKNVEHSQAKRGENLFQEVNLVKNIYEGSIILGSYKTELRNRDTHYKLSYKNLKKNAKT